MRDIGVDIRIVGLFNLAQIPWAFKVLWSPFMDRYVPGFWGRRRGWMAVMQIALLGLCLLLGGVGDHPDAIWVVGALALAVGIAAASQDIAVDAYAVEVLRPEEHGVAVGARVALYRAGMLIAGGGAISLAALLGWGVVNALLGLIFVPILLVTWRAPEPEDRFAPPQTLRDAVWKPFLEALSRPRALEILAFVFFYKFADNLAQALTRPFLVDMGYGAAHRGIALGTVGLVVTIVGTFAGGFFTTIAGLGPALWAFGALQIFSNLGYFFVAGADGSLAWMYGATAFELLTGGLGTGAFSVLLLRITEKRFSATQYALFSGLFALPRLLAGPFSGFAVDALDWRTFFLSTMAMGIPGLVLLHRFSPLGVRDPQVLLRGGGRAGDAPPLIGTRRPLRHFGDPRRRDGPRLCRAARLAQGAAARAGSGVLPRSGTAAHPEPRVFRRLGPGGGGSGAGPDLRPVRRRLQRRSENPLLRLARISHTAAGGRGAGWRNPLRIHAVPGGPRGGPRAVPGRSPCGPRAVNRCGADYDRVDGARQRERRPVLPVAGASDRHRPPEKGEMRHTGARRGVYPIPRSAMSMRTAG